MPADVGTPAADPGGTVSAGTEATGPTGCRNSLHARYPQYRIGRWSYGDPDVQSWGEGVGLTIGSFCSMAPGVKILLGGEHRPDWATTFPFNVLWEAARDITGHPMTKGDVVIGNDVWLGTDATILSGVVIGDGAVVAAGAVVASDVDPYAIVAGNPARLVRHRFSPPVVARFLTLRWWDWTDDEIARMLPRMLSPDVEGFLDEAERCHPAT